ncbi:hypothetical protein DFR30_2080 [Thiogranum longum]|uniref:Uncharacterized protein n=1 Tax=Thiogranum longum TaxID=1537524 RepID=A0A4V2PH01_9GAMM|nr:hypothetical protein [Thiogranum longum]TCK18796.1 hypothetical protein DFR30_2080 [Thiogranum longum]
MMKISDKALKLIGRKLLSSMEASSDQDSSTSTHDSTLAAYERAMSLEPGTRPEPKKAQVLLFRDNSRDD